MSSDDKTKLLSYLERFRVLVEPHFGYLAKFGYSAPAYTVTQYGYYAVYRSPKVWLCVAMEHREGGINVKVGRVEAAVNREPGEERAGEPYLYPASYVDLLTVLLERARDTADRIIVLREDFSDREKQLEVYQLYGTALKDYCEDILCGEVLFGS